jgi:hypothetical protein
MADGLLFKKDKEKKIVFYYGKCKICSEEIEIQVPFSVLESVEYYPFEYSFIHSDPPHGMLLYIDANWSIRGIEKLKNVSLGTIATSKPEEQKEVDIKYKLKKKIKITPMIVKLGIVTKREFDIISLIEQNKGVKEIAKEINVSESEVDSNIQKLLQKSMIEKI